MSFLLAETAARLPTFPVLAAELLVHFDWRAFHLKVAEGAFGQEVQTRCPQVLLLLHMFKPLEGLHTQHLLKLGPREGAITVVDTKALGSAL